MTKPTTLKLNVLANVAANVKFLPSKNSVTMRKALTPEFIRLNGVPKSGKDYQDGLAHRRAEAIRKQNGEDSSVWLRPVSHRLRQEAYDNASRVTQGPIGAADSFSKGIVAAAAAASGGAQGKTHGAALSHMDISGGPPAPSGPTPAPSSGTPGPKKKVVAETSEDETLAERMEGAVRKHANMSDASYRKRRQGVPTATSFQTAILKSVSDAESKAQKAAAAEAAKAAAAQKKLDKEVAAEKKRLEKEVAAVQKAAAADAKKSLNEQRSIILNISKLREKSAERREAKRDAQNTRDQNTYLKAYHAQQRAELSKTAAAAEKAAKAMRSAGFAQRIMNQAASVFVGLSLHRAWQSVFTAVATSKDEFLEFERILQRMNAITDKLSSSSLPKFRKEIRDAATAIGRDPADIATGAYEALQTNINDPTTALQMASLAGKGATLGGTDTKTVMTGLLAVMNAYYGDLLLAANRTNDWTEVNKKAALTMDQLFVLVRNGAIKWEQLDDAMGNTITTAASMGFKIEEVMAAIATLTKQGLSPSKATTGIQNLLLHLAKSSGEAESAAAALGIEFSGTSIAANGLFGMLTQVSSAIGRTGVDVEGLAAGGANLESILAQLSVKTALSTDKLVAMFPDLRTLRAVAGLTGTGFQMMGADLVEVGGAAGEMAEAWTPMLKSLPVRVDIARLKVKNFTDAIWQKLYPAMISAGEAAITTGGDFATGFAGSLIAPVVALGHLATSINYVVFLMGDPFEKSFGAASKIVGALTGGIVLLTAAVVGLKVVTDGASGVGIGAKLFGGLSYIKSAYKGAGSFGARAGGMAANAGRGIAGLNAAGVAWQGGVASNIAGAPKRWWNGAAARRAANNPPVDILMGDRWMPNNVRPRDKRIAKGVLQREGRDAALESGSDYLRTDLRNKPTAGRFKRFGRSIHTGAAKGVGTVAAGGYEAATAGLDLYTKKLGTATAAKATFRSGVTASKTGLMSLGKTLFTAGASFGVWGLAAAAAAGLVIAAFILIARNSTGLTAAFEGVKQKLTNIFMAIGRVVFDVINGILEILEHWVNFWLGIVAIWTNSSKTLSDKIKDTGKIIVTVYIELGKTILKSLRFLMDGIMLLWANQQVALRKVLWAIIDLFIEWGAKIVDSIKTVFSMETLQSITDWAMNIGPKMWNGFVNGMNKLGGNAAKWAKKALGFGEDEELTLVPELNLGPANDAWNGMPPELKKFLTETVGSDVSGVQDQIDQARKALGGMSQYETRTHTTRTKVAVDSTQFDAQLAAQEAEMKRHKDRIGGLRTEKTGAMREVRGEERAQMKAYYDQLIAAEQMALDRATADYGKMQEKAWNSKSGFMYADVTSTETVENSRYAEQLAYIEQLQQKLKETMDIQTALGSVGIQVGENFDWSTMDDLTTKILEAKLAARRMMGVESGDMDWLGLDGLKDKGLAFGSNIIDPMLSGIEKIQAAWALTFKAIGEDNNLEPIELSIGTFDDFIKSLQNNSDAVEEQTDSQAEQDKWYQKMLESQQGMNDALAGKRLDQNITLAPYIEIKIENGDLTPEQRAELVQTVQDAIAADVARSTGRRLWGA